MNKLRQSTMMTATLCVNHMLHVVATTGKNRRRGWVLTQIPWKAIHRFLPVTCLKPGRKDPSRSEDSTIDFEPYKRFIPQIICGSADSKPHSGLEKSSKKARLLALHLSNALLTLGLNGLIVHKIQEPTASHCFGCSIPFEINLRSQVFMVPWQLSSGVASMVWIKVPTSHPGSFIDVCKDWPRDRYWTWTRARIGDLWSFWA